MNSTDWISQYNTVKRGVVVKRQEGKQCPPGEIKRFHGEVAELEKSLNAMKAAAMEYELCVIMIIFFCYF